MLLTYATNRTCPELQPRAWHYKTDINCCFSLAAPSVSRRVATAHASFSAAMLSSAARKHGSCCYSCRKARAQKEKRESGREKGRYHAVAMSVQRIELNTQSNTLNWLRKHDSAQLAALIRALLLGNSLHPDWHPAKGTTLPPRCMRGSKKKHVRGERCFRDRWTPSHSRRKTSPS